MFFILNLSNVTILHMAYQFCIKLKLINPVKDLMIHGHGKPGCKTNPIIFPNLRVWNCIPKRLPQPSLRILIGEPDVMVVFSNVDIPI